MPMFGLNLATLALRRLANVLLECLIQNTFVTTAGLQTTYIAANARFAKTI